MSFQNIGVDNLQASKAFKQIRANSKTYTTNLTYTPSPLTSKYLKFNSLFFNDTKLMDSNAFTLRRAATLTSAAASTANNATFLDPSGLDKFLAYNLQYHKTPTSTKLFNTSEDLWTKRGHDAGGTGSLNSLNILFSGNRRFSAPALKLVTLYPNLIRDLGDDSDKKPVSYPFRKLLKKTFTKSLAGRLKDAYPILNINSNDEYSGVSQTYMNTSIDNLPKTSKDFMIQYSYQSQPFSKQSVRRYKNLTPHTSNYNLSLGLNPVDSDLLRSSTNATYSTMLSKYNAQKTN